MVHQVYQSTKGIKKYQMYMYQGVQDVSKDILGVSNVYQ